MRLDDILKRWLLSIFRVRV